MSGLKTNTNNLATSFEKFKEGIKEPIYGLKRMGLTDTLTLTKHGKPVLIIPDELEPDFIHILARVLAIEDIANGRLNRDDIPANLFCSPNARKEPPFETL